MHMNDDFWSRVDTQAFFGANYVFSKSGPGDTKVKHKLHDLVEKKLQKAKDKWNEDRIKRLDFITKKLHQKNGAKAYSNNVDEAILCTIEYLQKR